VEGSVLRSGDQVRITAQLIQVRADKHLWAESYHRNVRDTLAVQNQIARAIAEQIRIEVTPQEQAFQSAKKIDPEAYEAYLKGRYSWNRRAVDGLHKPVDYFNQAIAGDPNYAAAYGGLVDTYALLGDWQYAVMTTSLAFFLDGFDWNPEAGDREFRRAIRAEPYETAHHWYAWLLSLLGRNSEAIAEMRKA